MNMSAVKPRYSKDLGTMKIILLYRVSCYIRVKKRYKELDHEKTLVIKGFCYMRSLYNEVPLY